MQSIHLNQIFRFTSLTQSTTTQSLISIVFPYWVLLRANRDTVNNYGKTTVSEKTWQMVTYLLPNNDDTEYHCQLSWDAHSPPGTARSPGHVISFKTQSNLLRPILLLFTFYRWGNWGREALGHLPSITGRTAFRMRNHNEVCLVLECAFFTPAY